MASVYCSWFQVQRTSTWNPRTHHMYGKSRNKTYPIIASGRQHGGHKITTYGALLYRWLFLYALIRPRRRRHQTLKTTGTPSLPYNDDRRDRGKILPFHRLILADCWTTAQLQPRNNPGGFRAPPPPDPV